MRARPVGSSIATVALVALLFAAPYGAAEEGDGIVTARSPVLLQGTSSTAASRAVAAFSSDASAPIDVKVTGESASVYHARFVRTCRESGLPPFRECVPVANPTDPGSAFARGEHDDYTVRDFTLALTPGAGGFLVAWGAETPAEDVVDLHAFVAGAATLGVDPEPRYFAPGAEAWCEDSCGDWSPVYSDGIETENDTWFLGSDGPWEILGGGKMRIVVFGVVASVVGTAEDGSTLQETYTTGQSSENVTQAGQVVYRRDQVEFLIVDAEEADLEALVTAPGRLYGEHATESFGTTVFREATGKILLPSGRRSFSNEDVAISGNLTIVPVAVLDTGREDARVLLDVEGEVAAIAAEPATPFYRNEAGAAVAIGFGSLALLGAAGYYWPWLKYVGTAAVLPLYSRIGREEVLEHEKREQIYQLIRDSPGIHAHEISTKAAVGWGTTVYHLKLLENHGLVVGKRTGRYKRFFASAGGAVRNVDAYAILRNLTTASIARHVLAHPGCIQKDVCAALNLGASLVTWHMHRLEEADLVKKVRDGRTVRYYAGGGWSGLQIGFGPTQTGVVEPVADPATN